MDAINGADKNAVCRESMKQLANPDKVSKSSSSALQSLSHNDVAGEEKHSAAENCKNVLERISCGGEGVKSEGKRAKRESDRGINKRHWHVRELEQKLSNVKCETIECFSDTCLFSDMCHHCTCPELGVRKLPSGGLLEILVELVMR